MTGEETGSWREGGTDVTHGAGGSGNNGKKLAAGQKR